MSLRAIREVSSNDQKVLDVVRVLLERLDVMKGASEHGDEKKSATTKFTSAIILMHISFAWPTIGQIFLQSWACR